MPIIGTCKSCQIQIMLFQAEEVVASIFVYPYGKHPNWLATYKDTNVILDAMDCEIQSNNCEISFIPC